MYRPEPTLVEEFIIAAALRPRVLIYLLLNRVSVTSKHFRL